MGRKELNTLASRTAIYGSSVGKRWFSPSRSYCKNGTHRNEEVGLGFVEIDPQDLTDSVRGIDERPDLLVAFAKLDYSFPRHQ